VKKGRIDEAREVLRLIGEGELRQELKDIIESIDAEHVTSDALFTAKYRVPIFSGISIGMFNQTVRDQCDSLLFECHLRARRLQQSLR